jgi:hypothetical protein
VRSRNWRSNELFNPQVWEQCDLIRRQLLGACTTAGGYFDPQPDDVPLRAWMKEHLAPAEIRM